MEIGLGWRLWDFDVVRLSLDFVPPEFEREEDVKKREGSRKKKERERR